VHQHPTSPKRKRGHAVIETPGPTPVPKQDVSGREGGDIDLEMLDQEAFARVIASGQHHQAPAATVDNDGEEEEEGHEGVDDATYHPSTEAEGADGADPIWNLRMACLPVLDIFV